MVPNGAKTRQRYEMTNLPLAYALMRRGESEATAGAAAAAASVAAEPAARAGEEAAGPAAVKVFVRAAKLKNFRRYLEPRSLTFRLVVGATLWSVLAFMGVGLILSQLFRDSFSAASMRGSWWCWKPSSRARRCAPTASS